MQKVTFLGKSGFYSEVKARVDEYFTANNISPYADRRMKLKTGVILTGLVASYIFFLMSGSSLVWTLIAAIAVGQGFVLVGFNIMHDGAHGSYSNNRKLNWLMGFSLDLIGGSSFFWHYKHNILHHTYTNIDGVDDDIDVFGILRFSPEQPWRRWHRFQHLFALPLYSLLMLQVFISDFIKFVTGKVGSYKIPRPNITESTLFLVTKLFYLSYVVLIPLFFLPLLNVLIFFVVVNAIVGFTMATVFQLAHVMEDNAFPRPEEATGVIDNEWAIHQVETTANFKPTSKLVSWYCGGLNFQVEHHLFPKICHIHYPEISKIVERTCEQFQINYVSYPRLRDAVRTHFRFLKKLGKVPTPA